MTPCPELEPCLSNLRPTRVRLPNDRGVYQSYGFGSKGTRRGLGNWRGGTAAELRDEQGRLMSRVTGGTTELPLSLGSRATIRIEDRLGTAPRVRLYEGGVRADGEFGGDGSASLFGAKTLGSAALGDLDGDGVLDLVVAERDTDLITIRPGVTGPATRLPMGAGPLSVALGDFDGDGELDVATTDEVGASITTRLGDGLGSFGPAATVQLGQAPRFLTLGDVDRDGAVDMVVSNVDGSVSLLLGRGEGRFGAEALLPAPAPASVGQQVALGDLDGDGLLDIVAVHLVNGGNGFISVRLAISAGVYLDPIAFGDLGALTEDGSVALADFDGDGALDVVTIKREGFTAATVVVIYLGDGDGTFGPPILSGSTNLGARWLAVDDYDSDGWPDVAVAGYKNYEGGLTLSFTLEIVTGNGDGTLTICPVPLFCGSPPCLPDCIYGSGFISAGTATFITTGDVDGDGALDLIGLYDNGVVRLEMGHGTTPSGVEDTSVTIEAKSPVLDDIDSDGELDLVLGTYNNTSNFTTGRVQFHPGDGSGGFGARLSLGPSIEGANGLSVGDINGDGRPDIAASGEQRGLLGFGSWVTLLTQNPSGTFASSTLSMGGVAIQTDSTDVLLTRLDGNAAVDIIAAVSGGVTDNLIGYRYGVGNGTFNALRTLALPDAPVAMAAGHLDDNLRLDLAIANGNAVTIARQNPARNLGIRRTLDAGSVVQSVAVADLDGDGLNDVIAAVPATGVSIWLGEGNGSFGPRNDLEMGAQPYDVAAGDLNGDGVLDLVSANLQSDDLSIRLGRGDGTFGSPAHISVGAAPWALALGQLDGAGSLLDVVTVSPAGSYSVWLRTTTRTWTQELTDLAQASTPIGADQTDYVVHQAMQLVDRVSVRVRIEGVGLENLSLTLTAPDGQQVQLDDGARWVGQGVWQAHYTPTTTPLLVNFEGWQPEDDWTLTVQNAGAEASLNDFAVITHGRFATP